MQRDSVSTAHARALRFVLRDYEAVAAGLKSSVGDQLVRMYGAELSAYAKKHHAPADPLSLSDGPVTSSATADARLTPSAVEDWCDSPWIEAGLSRADVCAAHVALRALSLGTAAERDAAGVLRLVHGPRPAGEPIEALGDLWPLARYVERVEDVRQELIEQRFAVECARSPRLHQARAPRLLDADAYPRMRRGIERSISSGDALRVALASPDREDFVRIALEQAEALLARSERLFDGRLPTSIPTPAEPSTLPLCAEEDPPPSEVPPTDDGETNAKEIAKRRGITERHARRLIAKGKRQGLVRVRTGGPLGKTQRVSTSYGATDICAPMYEGNAHRHAPSLDVAASISGPLAAGGSRVSVATSSSPPLRPALPLSRAERRGAHGATAAWHELVSFRFQLGFAPGSAPAPFF